MKKQFDYSTPRQYTFGFIFSIILTIFAFLSVGWSYSKITVIFLLVIFAIGQLVVQLVFSLHLNKEQYPKWNLMMFLLAAWFVLAIVIGSIWIMANLEYNMMPEEVEVQMIKDEGYKL